MTTNDRTESGACLECNGAGGGASNELCEACNGTGQRPSALDKYNTDLGHRLREAGVGQQPAQPLDVSWLPMGDPHPIELSKAGCDPITGQPAQPLYDSLGRCINFRDVHPAQPGSGDVVPRSRYNAANKDWLDEKAAHEKTRQAAADEIERLQSALTAAKAYADDMEARYHTAHERLTAARQRIADLESDLETERARGIHTCHDQCQRPLCVAQRRIAAITSVVNSHLVDLDGVANIFRANGMAESADEVDKAITELQEATKEPS